MTIRRMLHEAKRDAWKLLQPGNFVDVSPRFLYGEIHSALHTATTLLDKGWELDDDVDVILSVYPIPEDAPRKEETKLG